MNIAALNASLPDQAGKLDAMMHARRSATPLSPAALRQAPPDVQRKEVAAQFEAILVRQLLGPTMTSMLGHEGGAASNVYSDMITDTFAQQLTRGGGGIGLSQLLEQQLTPRAPHAAPNATAPTTAP